MSGTVLKIPAQNQRCIISRTVINFSFDAELSLKLGISPDFQYSHWHHETTMIQGCKRDDCDCLRKLKTLSIKNEENKYRNSPDQGKGFYLSVLNWFRSNSILFDVSLLSVEFNQVS